MFAASLVAVSSLVIGASAQLTPANVVPASVSGALSALKYTNVGGSGSYPQVTDMIDGEWPSCTVNPSCITQPKAISGNLAPFDDEVGFSFRGPLNIENIAIYQPANDTAATWKLTSSYQAGEDPNNLVFMANLGGGASGSWSICGGSSQAYASADFTDAAAEPTTPSTGNVPEGHEINIMTAETCASSPCPGFARGTANHAWAGSKFFVATFSMPPSSDPSNVPALWALNGQVYRAAQYGCNCRGVGDTPNCGELDILEALPNANPDQTISEIYTIKGATGTGANYFDRPLSDSVTYGVIFDVKTDSIAIQRYDSWDYTQTALTRSVVDGYLGATALDISVNPNSRRSDARRSVMGSHRRRHEH